MKEYWKLQRPGCFGDPSGTYVFDGTEQGGITWPVVRAAVKFPMVPTAGITAARKPNIQDGQIFSVTAEASEFLADGSMFDDPIGTVKLWPASYPIPSGWREHPGLQGRFPVGLAPGDPDFGTLGNTGGTKTHTHGSTSGTTGTVQGTIPAAAASHLPPYRVVKFIERYQ